ncbi:MAG: four helix bundle protein [bacterium]
MSRDIEKYEVFQLSHQLVLKIYEMTKHFPAEEKFSLVLQMRRSAYSIPMNLAEGGMRKVRLNLSNL